MICSLCEERFDSKESDVCPECEGWLKIKEDYERFQVVYWRNPDKIMAEKREIK